MPVGTADSSEMFFDKTSLFSNHAFTPFFYNGLEFKTMTHFLEYQKAMKLHRSQLATSILQATTAEQCATINDDMTYSDLNQWYTEVEDVAMKGLFCKFKQNPTLLSSLLKSNGSKLVYTSSNDGFWGIALGRQEAARIAQQLWPGRNMLGDILMKIRATFTADDQQTTHRTIYN